MQVYRPYKPKDREHKEAFIDIEGYRDYSKNEMIPYLIGIYIPNYHKGEFGYIPGEDCIKRFINQYISHSFRNYTFYSHFGSIFDFPMLLQELNKLPFKIYPITRGSKIIKMTITDNNNHQWKFVDTSALLSFSLDKLTKTFNVLHKKLNIIEKNDSYDQNLYSLFLKDKRLVIEYLKHDCMGLYQVMENFRKQMALMNSDIGLTIASTALKSFNHNYQKNSLYMCSKDVNDELRKAMYGGRTEIFKMIAEKRKDDYYYYYDVNSLYPYVMFENNFPISKPKIINEPSKNIYVEFDGITQAKIKSPDQLYIPLLPHKTNVNKTIKLMFLLGNFEGYWDNLLLRKAKDIGYKITPIKSFIFDTEPIFKDYVSYFYKIKQAASPDTPMYLIAKLMMNSLYGKFGQRQESELTIKDTNPDPEKYTIIDIDLEKGWSKVKEEGHGKFYLPQISAHVTALAQIHLYSIMEKIIDKGYNVYYCDTDSITTDYKNMGTSNRLGDLKLEKKIVSGYFLLPKTYKILTNDNKTEIRAKGYSKNLQKMIKADAFENALLKNDTSGFTVISSKKELLRPFACLNRTGEFNKLDYIRRSIQTQYNKRKILADFDTRPFYMKELI